MEEIQRVGRHWQRVAALVCKHTEWTYNTHGDNGWTCGDCDRPLRVLSDIQIEEMTKQKR